MEDTTQTQTLIETAESMIDFYGSPELVVHNFTTKSGIEVFKKASANFKAKKKCLTIQNNMKEYKRMIDLFPDNRYYIDEYYKLETKFERLVKEYEIVSGKPF